MQSVRVLIRYVHTNMYVCAVYMVTHTVHTKYVLYMCRYALNMHIYSICMCMYVHIFYYVALYISIYTLYYVLHVNMHVQLIAKVINMFEIQSKLI